MKIFLIRHASVDYTNDMYRDKYVNLSQRGTLQAVEMAEWKQCLYRVISRNLEAISSYAFKSPPVQYRDDAARKK